MNERPTYLRCTYCLLVYDEMPSVEYKWGLLRHDGTRGSDLRCPMCKRGHIWEESSFTTPEKVSRSQREAEEYRRRNKQKDTIHLRDREPKISEGLCYHDRLRVAFQMIHGENEWFFSKRETNEPLPTPSIRFAASQTRQPCPVPRLWSRENKNRHRNHQAPRRPGTCRMPAQHHWRSVAGRCGQVRTRTESRLPAQQKEIRAPWAA